jgi:hypothetical protein
MIVSQTMRQPLRRLLPIMSLTLVCLTGCAAQAAPASPTLEPTPQPTHTAALGRNPGVAATPAREAGSQSLVLPTIAATTAYIQIVDAQVKEHDTVVTLKGAGPLATDHELDLAGWYFKAKDRSAQVPQGAVVRPDRLLTLHATAGQNTSGDVYLGLDAQAVADFLEPGIQLVLQDPSGAMLTTVTVPAHTS